MRYIPPVIPALLPLDNAATVIGNTSSTVSELKAVDFAMPIVVPTANIITQTNSTGSECMNSLASAKTLVQSLESHQQTVCLPIPFI